MRVAEGWREEAVDIINAVNGHSQVAKMAETVCGRFAIDMVRETERKQSEIL